MPVSNIHISISSNDTVINFLNRLKYTRAILDAIHSGELAKAEYETYDTFNLHIPTSCAGVPNELLNPKKSWNGKASFREEVTKLGALFVENFKEYADVADAEVIKAGESMRAHSNLRWKQG